MKLTTFTCKGCQYIDSNDVALCVGKEPRNISGLVVHGRSSFDVDVIAHPKWGVIDCYFIWHNCDDWVVQNWNRAKSDSIFERATMTVLSTSSNASVLVLVASRLIYVLN